MSHASNYPTRETGTSKAGRRLRYLRGSRDEAVQPAKGCAGKVANEMTKSVNKVKIKTD